VDKYKIEIPEVKEVKSNFKFPNLTPFIVVDTDNDEVSTVIISNDRAIWFSTDGMICHSDLDYLQERHIRFIREFQPGDTLKVSK
jgi:hypothetical protein